MRLLGSEPGDVDGEVLAPWAFHFKFRLLASGPFTSSSRAYTRFRFQKPYQGDKKLSLSEEGGSDPVKFLVDVAGDQRLLKRHGHNAAALESHHFAEFSAVDHLAGGNSEARG